MDNSQAESLPEKCCVKCGFLYGLTNEVAHAADRESAIFDPDLIRIEAYLDEVLEDIGFDERALVASQVYTISTRIPSGVGPGTLPATRTENISREKVKGIFCYRNLLERISVTCRGRDEPLDKWSEISQAIQKDRSDCPGFFKYHAGYTAPQHVQVLLEERRIERQENHERAIAELQEEHAKSLKRATWVLGAC